MRLHPHVKLNLGLNVLRKRPDGYHDIETLMIPYPGMADVLDVEPLRGGKDGFLDIEIEGNAVNWKAEDDICAKAYRLLSEEYGLPSTSIRLLKKTPAGAGLGGGSSDGVSVLKALNEIYSLGLGKEELKEKAAMLGSDCAFFVEDRPCICTGRGEKLEAFDMNLEEYEIRLGIPEGVAVSTAEAYSGMTPGIPERSLRDLLSLPVEQWRGKLVNDFEKTVFPRHPEIRLLKEKFYEEGAVYASMSGSGSSVFALFKK